MLATILSWIAGGGLNSILGKIEGAYEAKLKAQNDSQRIDAEQRIAMLEAQRDSVLASQSNRVGQLVRAAWAIPFIIYNGKLVLWDKVLGWGTTDPLSAQLTQIEMVILGGYFLFSTARALKNVPIRICSSRRQGSFGRCRFR